MVSAYVESLIREMSGVNEVVRDEDGDYPVRCGGALYYVQVAGAQEPLVHVYSIVLSEVEDTEALMREINRVNSMLGFCRMFYANGQVFVTADNLGLTLDEEEFRASCSAVAAAADHFGPGLHERFGGHLAFAEEKDETYDSAENPHTGFYM